MQQLQALTLLHCNSGDALCAQLSVGKSLLRLKISIGQFNAENCGLTEEGVKHITEMKQLQSLVLGNPTDHSDDPNAKTPEAYKLIFKNL